MRRGKMLCALLAGVGMVGLIAPSASARNASPADDAAKSNQGSGQNISPDTADQAATVADQKSDQASSDIVVTGIRRSIISSINTKKRLDIIADVISSEDIGKFPDRNIAESLQRITGVQITRQAGEGQFVSVRALPAEFNLVTVDGHYMAEASIDQLTQKTDRRFDFSILPPDFVQALEVYKSPRADLDEGGVAATTNVKTLRPLELGKRVLTAAAEGQYEGNGKSWAPKVTGAFADTFLDGKLGIALSGVYDKRKYKELSTTTGQLDSITWYTNPDPKLGQLDAKNIQGTSLQPDTKYLMVDSIGRSLSEQTRTRKTFTATAQYEPVEHLRFTVQGLYADFKGVSNSASFTSRPYYGVANSAAAVISAQADANNVITSLQTPDSVPELGAFHDIERRKIKSGSGDMTFDDGVTFARLRTAYSDASAKSQGIGYDNMVWGRLSHTTAAGGYVMDPSDPVASIVLPGGIPALSQFGNSYIGDNVLKRSDRSFEIAGDFSRDLNLGFLRRIRVGTKFAIRKRTNNAQFLQDQRVHNLASPALQNLDQFVSGTANADIPIYSGSNLNFTEFPRFSPQAYLDLCCGGSLSNWQQGVRAGYAANPKGALTVRDNPGLDYGIKESTQAGYAVLDFGRENAPISGNIGVRIVNTDQSINTVSVDLSAIEPSSDPNVPPVIPAAGPLRLSRSYTDILPSFNVTWALADRKILIRGAVAKVLSRPNLDFLVPRYAVSTTTGNGTAASPYNLSGGNPALKPYHAWQYDLSFEYYPKPGTIISLALFQKDIDHYIYTGFQTVTAGDFTYTAALPINGASARVRGVEFGATTLFGFLPGALNGLGAQFNLTYADGNIKADPANGYLTKHPFEGLSKWTYNAVLFYEKYGFTIRGAYSYRGSFPSVYNLRNTGQLQQTKAFGTLDGHISYDLTKHFQIYADGINILNEANVDRIQLPNGDSYPLNYIQSGRRIILGARAKF